MSQPRKKNRSRKFKVESLPQHLQHINVNAAGIDIGAEQHLVAVPEGRDEAAVREFGAAISKNKLNHSDCNSYHAP